MHAVDTYRSNHIHNAVVRAACRAVKVSPKRATVEVVAPVGGVAGEWVARVMIVRESSDLEEAGGILCRRPVESVDLEEIVDVLVEPYDRDHYLVSVAA